MKYFNKEWYELMQKQFMTDGIKTIAEKEYSDKEIEEMYNKELKKEIERSYEEYNTPPDDSILKELIEGKIEFNPEEWLFVDEESDTVEKITSKEQVIANLSREYEEELKEFNNRPQFNENEVIEDFKQSYKAMLEIKNYLPKWVYEEVDNRLIALNCMPNSVLKKLKVEEKQNNKKIDKIMKDANADFRRQDIGEELYNKLNFHDEKIVAFKNQGKNYEMTIKNYEDEVIKIVFEETEIIELEDIDFKNCYWLYEEIYKEKDTYEVHLMVESKGLRYITLRCKKINIK